MNGYELNKSYDADNTDFSVSDVSTWFQTKIPNNAISKTQDRKKSLADETFETKVANFRNLLIKVKEIIDGKTRIVYINIDVIKPDFFRFLQR